MVLLQSGPSAKWSYYKVVLLQTGPMQSGPNAKWSYCQLTLMQSGPIATDLIFQNTVEHQSIRHTMVPGLNDKSLSIPMFIIKCLSYENFTHPGGAWEVEE